MHFSTEKKYPNHFSQRIKRKFLWLPLLFNKRFYWLEYVKTFEQYQHFDCKLQWRLRKIEVLNDDLSVIHKNEPEFMFSELVKWNEN